MNTYFAYILFVGSDTSDIMRYTCGVATRECRKDIHTHKSCVGDWTWRREGKAMRMAAVQELRKQ